MLVFTEWLLLTPQGMTLRGHKRNGIKSGRLTPYNNAQPTEKGRPTSG